MARIKTEKYVIDGQEIEVHFNCSKSGVFSTNLPYTMVEKLGIERKVLEGTSLSEIECLISRAFGAYKDANTSYKLKIAISFGASGDFTNNPDGSFNEKFIGGRNPFKMESGFSRINSRIGLDYKILIEENRDGRISYYNAVQQEKYKEISHWQKQVGNFVSSSTDRLKDEDIIIDYTEVAFQNLLSITSQLQKASSFLVELLSSDKMEFILSSENLKLIE